MAKKGKLGDVWWLFGLRGILLIFLGLAFLFHPLATITGTVWIIGIFWFVSGLITLVMLMYNTDQWFLKLVSGLLSLIVGGWIAFPGGAIEAVDRAFAFKGAVALIWGIGALIIGLLLLVEGLATKSWPDVILGAFQILFGIIIVTNLFTASLAVPYVFGVFALLAGFGSLLLAYRFFKERNELTGVPLVD